MSQFPISNCRLDAQYLNEFTDSLRDYKGEDLFARFVHDATEEWALELEIAKNLIESDDTSDAKKAFLTSRQKDAPERLVATGAALAGPINTPRHRQFGIALTLLDERRRRFVVGFFVVIDNGTRIHLVSPIYESLGGKIEFLEDHEVFHEEDSIKVFGGWIDRTSSAMGEFGRDMLSYLQETDDGIGMSFGFVSPDTDSTDSNKKREKEKSSVGYKNPFLRASERRKVSEDISSSKIPSIELDDSKASMERVAKILRRSHLRKEWHVDMLFSDKVRNVGSSMGPLEETFMEEVGLPIYRALQQRPGAIDSKEMWHQMERYALKKGLIYGYCKTKKETINFSKEGGCTQIGKCSKESLVGNRCALESKKHSNK